MKTLYIKLLFVGIIISCFPTAVSAQQGMDYAGTNFNHYSRLNTVPGPPIRQSRRNEKAIGVYQSNIAPQSLLELNSTTNYSRFFLPSINDRGEVFRTSTPGNVTARWRFIQGGLEIGQFFSTTTSTNFQIQSSTSFLLLNTNGNFVGIGVNNPTENVDIAGIARISNIITGTNDFII